MNKKELVKKIVLDEFQKRKQDESFLELKIKKPSFSKLKNLEDNIFFRLLKVFRFGAIALIIVFCWIINMESTVERVYLSPGEYRVNAIYDSYQHQNYVFESRYWEHLGKFIMFTLVGILFSEIFYSVLFYIIFGKNYEK